MQDKNSYPKDPLQQVTTTRCGQLTTYYFFILLLLVLTSSFLNFRIYEKLLNILSLFRAKKFGLSGPEAEKECPFYRQLDVSCTISFLIS